MVIPNLSTTSLRASTDPQSFQRGEKYYARRAVSAVVQRQRVIQARVRGSNYSPYRVQVEFDSEGITAATCSCPYDWGGWCKHIVATLLTCLHQPNTIEQRLPVEELVATVPPQQLSELLQALVKQFPDTLEWLEQQIQVPQSRVGTVEVSSDLSSQGSPAQTAVAIDPAPFRQAASEILESAVEAWESGFDDDPLTVGIAELLAKVEEFADQGDGNTALLLLEAILEGVMVGWDQICNYGGDDYGALDPVDPVLTKAILTAQFPGETDLQWQEKIEQWQSALNLSLLMGLEALRQGWDYPPLQRILQGQEVTNQAMTSLPSWTLELAQIRLHLLDHQGRHEEYLRLAYALDLGEPYLLMLARLGRIEAVMAGLDHLPTLTAAHSLAQALNQQGWAAEAMAVVKLGLTLPAPENGYTHTTALVWMAEFAMEIGDRETAIAAWVAVFEVQPTLQYYQQVQSLSAEQWPTLQPQLLDHLRQSDRWDSQIAKVDIFLTEGLLEDAMAVVDSDRYSYQSSLALRVMDAVFSHYPDWVIQQACQRAEAIINRGKAKYYEQAVPWLKQARSAYFSSRRQADWQAYYTTLQNTHRRKSKLMQLMEQSLS